MCRVAGVWGHRYAASMMHTILFAQQHGGQDSCGIGVRDHSVITGLGKVDEVFPEPKVSHMLPGRSAIGHVRYATQGSVHVDHAAPFERLTSFGKVYLSHNGHIINYAKLRSFLEHRGIAFNGTSDGELMLKLIVYQVERNGHSFVKAIQYAMKRVRGAFSIVLLTPDGMYAFRDRHGFRPLVLGKKRRSHFIASETCALDMCGARYVREINAGEIVRISKQGVESFNGHPCNGCQQCIFCPIYFAFPSSKVFGIPVWKFQQRMGQRMAGLFLPQLEELIGRYGRERIVIGPVPDTAREATLEFCRMLGAMDMYDEFLIRSHFAGRTFMAAEQVVRDLKVKRKFSFVKERVQGKVVVILDDSIVRGSTLRDLVKILKEKCGALAVYVVIYSPQIIGPCHMGINTPTYRELIANRKGGPEKVARHLCADGLLHCRVKDLKEVIASFGKNPNDFCYSCFTGKYRIRITVKPAA